MKWAGAQARTARAPEYRSYPCAPAIATLGCVICQQIKSRANEIDELKLRNWAHAHERRATRCTDDCALRNGRVDHPALAEFLEQPIGDFKGATINPNVFADNKDCRITLQLLPDALANRFDECNQTTALGPG